ncbi:hypothetical protein U9M48_036403 [Paspalum notatum var. saurae]|uniref:Uncharacterized protein n=1 Tax=Paspalum notatum var. saurae TaxID=547442 RepID=A0AAQ3XA17_PASNO
MGPQNHQAQGFRKPVIIPQAVSSSQKSYPRRLHQAHTGKSAHYLRAPFPRSGLLHYADRSHWRKVDRTYPEFAEDARNIRFGLSTDGMNHNTWPVTLCMYNLATSMAKAEATRQRHQCVPTTNGQSNKGFRVCTHCLDETNSLYLKHCRKVVYMGHRQFLLSKHLLRKKGKHYTQADHRNKPIHRDGKIVFQMVKNLRIVLGKGSGSQLVPNEDGKGIEIHEERGVTQHGIGRTKQ